MVLMRSGLILAIPIETLTYARPSSAGMLVLRPRRGRIDTLLDAHVWCAQRLAQCHASLLNLLAERGRFELPSPVKGCRFSRAPRRTLAALMRTQLY